MARPTQAADLREPYRMVLNDGKAFVEFGRYVCLIIAVNQSFSKSRLSTLC